MHLYGFQRLVMGRYASLLAYLHVHFWEPVPGSRTKNWFPKVPQQK